MKIENYKCDVCGKMCIPITKTKIRKLIGWGYNSYLEICAHDRNGKLLDICNKCLLTALTKTLSEPEK